jgi:hypothetical protein
MKKISLTQGKFALVDDENYVDLMQFKWHAVRAGNTFYAERSIRIGKRTMVELMHRRILKLKPGDGKYTDHIDHTGCNNQKTNIRICSSKENNQNRSERSDNTSGYKGVSWYKRDKKWRAAIRINSKLKHLGLFESKIDAVQAYNNAAVEHFGKFANLNIIER